MATSFGMMDPAYFVGRKEIVEWINETLQLSLTKVEQTASGAVACQLLDRIYPGQVPMQKVNWEAKQDYEFIANYKVLQTAFAKLKVDKHVDVPKLIRAKYQDNLEFMQWFKAFVAKSHPPEEYDPVAQRAGGRGAPGACAAAGAGSRTAGSSSSSRASATTATVKRSSGGKENSSSSSSSSSYRSSSTSSSGSAAPAAAAAKKVTAAGSTKTVVVERQVDEALVAKAEMLSQENVQLQATVEGLEKERDFYFEKLTQVEELLQEKQAAGAASGEMKELIESVFKILYATESAPAAQPEDDSASANPVPAAAVPAAATELEPQEV